MTSQAETVYLLVLLCFVAAGGIFAEGSIFDNSNRHYKNSGITMYERSSAAHAAPIEYLKTPNFDVMLLSEENSDPTWRKYSELFQPKDLRNAQQVEVNYGGHVSAFAKGSQSSSIRLDRSEVESVLASLGGKKHIIVLHPRDCKSDFTMKEVKQSSLDEFENEFLPKLLQQLHKRVPEQRIGSDMVDPVIDRILMMLDKDEQKMLDDLRKTFEGHHSLVPQENSMYSGGYTTAMKRPSPSSYYGRAKGRTPKKPEPKTQLNNLLFKDPCNEGYVFLVQNHKNSADPSSLNDMLLRVLKVVTEAS